MDILTPTLPLISWLQSFPSLKWPMLVLSAFGSSYLYVIALAILYWCVNKRVGLDVGFLVLANAIVNNLVKVLFALPRPYWVSPAVHRWSSESGFGFPSGHAQGAILFWLFLALQVPAKRRPLAITLALLVSGLIGLSRIYLAVHFPADVVVGYVLGLLVLGIYWRCGNPFRTWFFLQPSVRKIALTALGSFLAIICFAVFSHLNKTESFPPFDAKALSWISIIGYTGAIFGLMIGVITRPSSQIPGNASALISRIFVGLGVIVAVWFGLTKLAVGDGITLTLGLRFLLGALVAWWIVDGAPRLFAIWEKHTSTNV